MTTTDVERFRQWRMGHPSANQTQCPACHRPLLTNTEGPTARGMHCLHTDDCAYMAWCADELDTLDIEPARVEYVRVCPDHGVVWQGNRDDINEVAFVCPIDRCTHYAHFGEPVELAECSCYLGGLYSVGTVESIRMGETDPWCPLHGVEDVRSGAYASWTVAQRRAFDRRLAAGLREDA